MVSDARSGVAVATLGAQLSRMADRAEWARRVAAWRSSGQSAAEFARSQGLALGTLKWWVSRLKRPPTSKAKPSTGVAMIRVQRETPREVSAVSVELAGAVVRVMPGADEATLTAVFGALRAGGSR